MVDLGATEDLGALVAELQEAIDGGELTAEQEPQYRFFLGLATTIRDARLAGIADEMIVEALKRTARIVD